MRLVIVIVVFISTTQSFASPQYRPVSIPTRDQKFLAADIYASDSTTPKPVILIQTPYNKNFYRVGVALPQAGGATFPYDSANYNYVIVDWRGFYGSLAAAVPAYDRGLDGYDIIQWIAQQRWSNGKVGTWGASALGEIQFETAKHHPPHLVCCVPLVKDFETRYDQYYCGGDYRKEHVQSLDSLGFLNTSQITAHPDSDLTWTIAQRTTDYPDSIGVPVLMIGGWFDHFPDDVLRAFDDLKKHGDPTVKSQHKLIVGPWMHTAVDQLQQGVWQFPNAVGYGDSIALRFFARYLRNESNNYENEPAVRYYQMGSNVWQSTDDWNALPVNTTTLFLTANGALSEKVLEQDSLLSTIVSDPRNPSPTVGGSRFNPFDKTILLGPQDQRALVESRSDVAIFSSGILTTDLFVDGATTFEGGVACDRTDADVSIRLCDVQSDGSSIILTQGILRMRFRDGLASEHLMKPGTLYPITIQLQNLAHTFLTGHRIRIDISGSDYPMFDLNLNNGGAMYNTAGDTLIATTTLRNSGTVVNKLILQTVAPSRVEQDQTQSPSEFSFSIAPNPIHDAATITITSPSSTTARVEIIDALGRVVEKIFDAPLSPGAHSMVYLPHDLPSGVFWCRVQTANQLQHYLMEILR